MLKLHVLTLISVLLLAIVIGCSSSDQGAIDKAVSETFAAQQGVIETAVASGLKTAVADNVELTATVIPTATSTPEPTATSKSTPDQEIEDISIKIIDIERRRTLLLEGIEPLLNYSSDAMAFGQRAEFGNLSELLLELAMLRVTPNLQPVKDGLLEVYRLEISGAYFHRDCVWWNLNEWLGDYQLNCGDRRWSVYPSITELNVVSTIDEAESFERLYFPNVRNPWTSAQMIRRTVYQYWYELLESNGTDTTHSDWRTLAAVNDSQ